MERDLFEVWIVFFHFQPFRSILFVFGGYVPGDTWYIRVLLFGTLQDHLDSLIFSFFRHLILTCFGLQKYTFSCKYPMVPGKSLF